MTHTFSHRCMVAALAGFMLVGAPAAAEVIAPAPLAEGFEGTEPGIQAQSWIVVAEVDAEGAPVLDDAGEPVVTLTPTQDGTVVPGATVRYEFAVANPTDAPLSNVAMDSPFPAEMALEVGTFTGPEGMTVAFDTAGEPGVWHQIHPLPSETERESMPSLDAIENLRVIVPDVPAGSQALVSYAAVVRQGPTSETQESE